MKVLKIAEVARLQARRLTRLMTVCALALPLASAAHAQFGSPFAGTGHMLFVPKAFVPQIRALNAQANINEINNFQFGGNNFALITVDQANLALPTAAVTPAFLQLNVNVINNVQFGSNNQAIIAVRQNNVAVGSPTSSTLWVPTRFLPEIRTLNAQANVNVINNVQVGNNNFALITVDQSNVALPSAAVTPAFLQLNVNVINNVQVGDNNVAIIAVNQNNVAG